MDHTDSIAQLAAALVKASAEMPQVKRTRTADTGKFKYQYADLADLIEVTRPVLAKHGLTVTQALEEEFKPAPDNFVVSVTTTLLHESGEWISSTFSMPAPSANPQTIGSVITYARRYAYQSVLGIAAEDDDDATIAEHAARSTTKPSPVVTSHWDSGASNPGAFVLTFGKHKGKTLREAGTGYARWLIDKMQQSRNQTGGMSERDAALLEVCEAFLRETPVEQTEQPQNVEQPKSDITPPAIVQQLAETFDAELVEEDDIPF